VTSPYNACLDKEEAPMMKTNKKTVGRVMARVLAEELKQVTGGEGPLKKTTVNGHLDCTDQRVEDTLGQ
jgi:hypothetical protein